MPPMGLEAGAEAWVVVWSAGGITNDDADGVGVGVGPTRVVVVLELPISGLHLANYSEKQVALSTHQCRHTYW